MQLDLFDGKTYDRLRDSARLAAQLATVRALMADGNWRTLDLIAIATGFPVPSISARLRDLRKAKFGGHKVKRRYVARGLWEYRLEMN